MCLWSVKFLKVISYVVLIIDEQRTINGSMAKYGSLFFTVGLILLTVPQTSEASVWWSSLSYLKPIPLPTFSITLRTILFITSFILIGIVLYIWKKLKLANSKKVYLKWVRRLITFPLVLFALWIIPVMPKVAQIITIIISAIFIIAVFIRTLGNNLDKLLDNQLKPLYWFIFLFAYTVGWIRGFSGIPANSFASNSIFVFGSVWFIVIVWIYFKSFGQVDKNK